MTTTTETVETPDRVEEHRILFWPSGSTGVPKIRLSSSLVSSKYVSVGPASASGKWEDGAYVIVGWIDQSDNKSVSKRASNNIITNTTAMAIGIIPLSTQSKYELNDKRQEEDDTTNSKQNPISLDSINSSLKFLAEHNPCSFTKSKSSLTSQGCGNCKMCATYQSLRVLSVIVVPFESEISAKSSTEETSGNGNILKHRHQVVLYNPTEAQNWHTQYSDSHQRQKNASQPQYLNGYWQRNLIQMGEALNVLENLALAMDYEQRFSSLEKYNSDSTKKSKIDEETKSRLPSCKNCSAALDVSSNIQAEKRGINVNREGIWNQSLLLLHLRTLRSNKSSTHSCSKCMLHRGWFLRKLAFGVLERMPLFLLVQILFNSISFSGRRSSSLKTYPPSFKVWSNQRKPENAHPSTAWIASILLDALLGMVIGYILVYYPFPIIKHIIALWRSVHNRLWDDGLQWLESFPVGFKLNVALTQQMGKEVRLGLLYHQTVASYIFRLDPSSSTFKSIPTPEVAIAIVQCVGSFTAFFGSRFFLAFAFDVTRLGTLHIHYLSCLFSSCQRFELSTLTSLWLLFRGKKRNILRCRSDHLQYDHMQLLLGMVFFTICLFLFTTILVYNCFFATMDYLASMVVCMWWCMLMAVEGGFHFDRIVNEKKEMTNYRGHWIGKGTQLIPAVLSGSSALSQEELAFLGYFFRGSFDMTNTEKNTPTSVGRSLNWGIKKDSNVVLPHVSQVSVDTNIASSMKIAFPVEHHFGIASRALGSFIVSRAARISALLQKLLLGKPCPMASSCVTITHSSRESIARFLDSRIR